MEEKIKTYVVYEETFRHASGVDPKEILIVHQFDGNGNHRLTGPNGEETRWTGYQEIAELTLMAGPVICATTDYFGEGVYEKRILPRKY